MEVDGHSKNVKGDLLSLKECCDDIEKYVNENLDGHIHGLCGFSMGATMAGVIEMLYRDVSSETIINACEFVYKYSIPEGLQNYRKPVLFLRGAREPYPWKSAAILKNYLPQMEERILDGMGHGQYLHEHPAEYSNVLLHFFSGRK